MTEKKKSEILPSLDGLLHRFNSQADSLINCRGASRIDSIIPPVEPLLGCFSDDMLIDRKRLTFLRFRKCVTFEFFKFFFFGLGINEFSKLVRSIEI